MTLGALACALATGCTQSKTPTLSAKLDPAEITRLSGLQGTFDAENSVYTSSRSKREGA